MLPTGHYELPPLSDFVVTETICPDPNALKTVTYTECLAAHHGVSAYWDEVRIGEYELVIEHERPTDVDVYSPEGRVIRWEPVVSN